MSGYDTTQLGFASLIVGDIKENVQENIQVTLELAGFVLWSGVDLWVGLIWIVKPQQKLGAVPLTNCFTETTLASPVCFGISIQFRYRERNGDHVP